MKRTLSLAVFLPLGFHLLADDGAGWPQLDQAQWESMTPTRVSPLLGIHGVNARLERGWTALMFAAESAENPAVVWELLKAGADPTLRDQDGDTAWDFIQNNEALRGTDVYWELNDWRFE